MSEQLQLVLSQLSSHVEYFKQYSLLEKLGFFTAAYIGGKLLCNTSRSVWRNGLAYNLGFGVQWRPGAWVVVTGASDGIGLEYCRQLADKGYSILMIARNKEKLNQKAADIKAKSPKCKEIRTLAVDFSRTDIYDTIANEIKKLPSGQLDVLVNNVGVFHLYPEYFCDTRKGYIDEILNVNMVSYTKMCEIVIPVMQKQKRGIIINLSSMAAILPMPLTTIYSASKVYLDYLSRGLQVEYKKDGIIIQSVLPGMVETNMSKTMGELNNGDQGVKVDDYVREALKTVGIETRTYGHWRHGFQARLMGGLFQGLLGENRTINLLYSVMAKMRADYYKKHKQN